MSRLAELREERAVFARRAQELNSQYAADQRMPQDAAEKLDAMIARIEQIDGEISNLSHRAEAAGQEITDRVQGGMRTPKEFRAHYLRNGAPRKEERVGLADFIRGVADMSTTSSVRAALSEGTDTAGGYLVPPFVMPQVLEALVPLSAVLSAGASILPLDIGAKNYTQAAIDAVPTAAWRTESGNVPQSDPTFRAVVAQPKSLAFYFKVSRELLADGGNLETVLTTVIAQAFAKELDRAALRGSGTAPEPRGLLNTSGVGAVGNGVNGAALAGYGNFFTAVQTVLQSDASMPTAAIMSPRSLVKLGGLIDTTNQPLAVPRMLQDMQMLATSQIPNNLVVGTSNDCSEIYIGDFKRVRFAMRERVSIQKLNELFATTGEIGFIGHVRADVMVEYPKAFAVVTGVRP